MKTVYALICPITRKVRYIGTTSKTLHERLYGHINARPDGNARKFMWIKQLKTFGKIPLIKELERFEKGVSGFYEAKYIYKYRKHDLLNIINDWNIGNENEYKSKTGIKSNKK